MDIDTGDRVEDCDVGSSGGGSLHRHDQPMFGVIVPGRPMITEFNRVHGGSRFAVGIENPADVSEVVFCLLNPTTFPPSHGICLYSNTAKTDEWRLIGVLSRDSPSGIFRTGWGSVKGIRYAKSMTLGVSVESSTVTSTASSIVRAENDRKDYPLKIAENIFFFLSSFSRKDAASGIEYFTVPVAALKKWLETFKEKLSRDPSFLFKAN